LNIPAGLSVTENGPNTDPKTPLKVNIFKPPKISEKLTPDSDKEITKMSINKPETTHVKKLKLTAEEIENVTSDSDVLSASSEQTEQKDDIQIKVKQPENLNLTKHTHSNTSCV
jgi:multidrug efflux pump subunit AcrB